MAYIDTHHHGTHRLDAGGDHYFVHDPQRDLPPQKQRPWATLVTSDAHDTASDLDRPGVYRLNIGLTKAAFMAANLDPDADRTVLDTVLIHPVYGGQYWVCVLNPDRTWPTVRQMLDDAHARAARRHASARERRR